MTKVAVYGFVRIVFDLLGEPAWWWSMLVLALGGVTAVMGVLYALMQHDLKRLLAYHTVENIGIIFIGLGLALAFKANGMPARRRWRSPPRCCTCSTTSCSRACCSSAPARCSPPPASATWSSSAASSTACRTTAFAFWSAARDLGAAAAQRLRVRMADLPGDPAEPAAAAVGAEDPGAGGRRAAGAVGGARRRLLRQGFRRHLSRPPRTPAAERAGGRPLSLAAMFVSPRSACSPASCPAVHRRAGAGGAGWSAGRMPVQRGVAGSRSCRSPRAAAPITACWSSCSCCSPARSRPSSIHRSPPTAAPRPAWDCGYPDPSPATQYTADSFAQPIRRVFGTVVFRAREHVEMPPPGDRRPARLTWSCATWSGTALRADRRRRRLRRRPAQSSAVPDHPPLSSAWSSPPSSLLLVLAIWP